MIKIWFQSCYFAKICIQLWPWPVGSQPYCLIHYLSWKPQMLVWAVIFCDHLGCFHFNMHRRHFFMPHNISNVNKVCFQVHFNMLLFTFKYELHSRCNWQVKEGGGERGAGTGSRQWRGYKTPDELVDRLCLEGEHGAAHRASSGLGLLASQCLWPLVWRWGAMRLSGLGVSKPSLARPLPYAIKSETPRRTRVTPISCAWGKKNILSLFFQVFPFNRCKLWIGFLKQKIWRFG